MRGGAALFAGSSNLRVPEAVGGHPWFHRPLHLFDEASVVCTTVLDWLQDATRFTVPVEGRAAPARICFARRRDVFGIGGAGLLRRLRHGRREWWRSGGRWQ